MQVSTWKPEPFKNTFGEKNHVTLFQSMACGAYSIGRLTIKVHTYGTYVCRSVIMHVRPDAADPTPHPFWADADLSLLVTDGPLELCRDLVGGVVTYVECARLGVSRMPLVVKYLSFCYH